MRIAIDAMGGDNAPEEIIKGALQAKDLIDGDTLVLIGSEQVMRSHLGDQTQWADKITLVDAPEIIGMDEPPVEALRRKRKSSIAVMAKMASQGEVDGIISAGNTGACVAASQLRMRLLPGVSRPGIVVVFPTFNGPVTVCDVGANVSPKPGHLHQYARMAAVYAREVVGVENPTVGLISVGAENAKGNELIKKTNQILRDDPKVDFIGNVESRDFMNRPADVVVCDGFVGNVILKLSEGMAEGLFRVILKELGNISPDLLDTFKPIIQKLYAAHDYSEYGGAPLLGIDGISIICHGSSDARTMKNAILAARRVIATGVNQKIIQQLEGVEGEEE